VPTDSDLYEIEVLDGEVVSTPDHQLETTHAQRLPSRAGQPGVQTAVAAATGFVAGAATLALLRRYGQARLERSAPAPALELRRVGPARTYVVTVRRLG
jgi:hypothetical protein